MATLMELPSGVHAAVSEGRLAVVGVTPQVASPVTVSVKLPLAHEPPTPEHEHEQLAVPSPLTTRRSVLIVSFGQVDWDDVLKSTGAQPSGTAWHAHPGLFPPSPAEPSPAEPSLAASVVAASGASKERSGSELQAPTVSATRANGR
jgi:hypothetical protein